MASSLNHSWWSTWGLSAGSFSSLTMLGPLHDLIQACGFNFSTMDGSKITDPALYVVPLPERLILSHLRASQTEHFIPVAPKHSSPLRVHLTTKSITIQPLNVLLATSDSLGGSVDSVQNIPHIRPLPYISVPVTLIQTFSMSSVVRSNLPTISLLPALLPPILCSLQSS